jgi:hypothetical protein
VSIRGSLFCLAVLLTLPALAGDSRIESSTRETIPFQNGGTLVIDDSFGDLNVRAWDRSEIELVVHKRTNRRYEHDEQWKGQRELDSIRIWFERRGDRVEIRTRFPGRGLFRMLRGKTNIDLRYEIRVPRLTHLRVRHDIGEVEVRGVEGDHDVTARIGEVNLRLPEHADYHFNARARIGDVVSSFRGRERRSLLVGANFETPYRRTGYRVSARVGIGEVRINSLPTPIF